MRFNFFNFKVNCKNDLKENPESCYDLKHDLSHKFKKVIMNLKINVHLNPSMTGALVARAFAWVFFLEADV